MAYEYEDRIVVVFTDKSRVNYSKKRYGSLSQKELTVRFNDYDESQ